MRSNVFVRDLNLLEARPCDGRRIEVVADGLPLFHGAQLAVDATIVSALKRDGSARPGGVSTPGVALVAAGYLKERTYPELVGPGARARLVVFGMEVGGRWSHEAWVFLRLLARARARSEPPATRSAARRAWQRRWSSILAVAAQRAVAESMLERPVHRGSECEVLSAAAVLEEARYLI